jgi:hypothetical protein
MFMEEFRQCWQCACCGGAEGVNGGERLMPLAGGWAKPKLNERLFARQLEEPQLETQLRRGPPRVRVLESLYKDRDGVGADLADRIRGACLGFRLVGIKVPEPSVERSSLPTGHATREDEDASDQSSERDHRDCD